MVSFKTVEIDYTEFKLWQLKESLNQIKKRKHIPLFTLKTL